VDKHSEPKWNDQTWQEWMQLRSQIGQTAEGSTVEIRSEVAVVTDSEEVFEDLDKRYRGTLCLISEQH